MLNLSKKIAAEKENIEKALTNLKTALRQEAKSPIELAGMATFVHNIYNGIENILKQILKSKNIKVGASEAWHKELLDLSMSNRIISEELANRLYEYLTFRHFFIHSYGFMLEEARLMELASNIPDVWLQFLSATEIFRKGV